MLDVIYFLIGTAMAVAAYLLVRKHKRSSEQDRDARVLFLRVWGMLAGYMVLGMLMGPIVDLALGRASLSEAIQDVVFWIPYAAALLFVIAPLTVLGWLEWGMHVHVFGPHSEKRPLDGSP